ncbi:MAG TPA: hypothetical protein DDZ62_02720 [Delftia acidovorans]|uniref:Uncharacterized protein n=2 Tax=Delftia TaxID=80865 RepID=A0AAX3SH28_9BURK|nr:MULTISPECIES: hypothetical protein [Delftia]MDX4955897.1 hypothetical protein [Delftia acidovorans]WFF79319.1 hypothetical protein PYR84_20535 [Delftia tsuruhatensis]HBJ98987.1 hypothetical protein [Delftia acidovorans]
MKFSTEELLLAERVRDMAVKIRDVRLGQAIEAWQIKQLSATGTSAAALARLEAEQVQFRNEWLKAHPTTEFVSESLKRLEDVAEVIRQSRKASSA